MKKRTTPSLATALFLLLGTPAMAGPGHDHGFGGHDHAAESVQDSHGHAHDGHFAGKAGDFASTKDALAALKATLSEADTAVQSGDLAAMDALYPRIEAAGAYIHDYAKAASPDVADRFHTSIDQMMAVFAEMHDASHGSDQAAAKRLLKKANGAVMLVENFLPASDRAQ